MCQKLDQDADVCIMVWPEILEQDYAHYLRAATPMCSRWPCNSYLLFLNLTHTTETGTAEGGETTDSNLCGPIEASSKSSAGVRHCCAFCQFKHPVEKCGAKTICWAKPTCFHFSSFKICCTVHRCCCSWPTVIGSWWSQWGIMAVLTVISCMTKLMVWHYVSDSHKV